MSEWDGPLQPEILTDLTKLVPLHDFVLVKPFPPQSVIIDPGVKMTRDFRWVNPRARGNRFATVVAIGKGDRWFGMFCEPCLFGPDKIDGTLICRKMLETAKRHKCLKCGGVMMRYSDLPGGPVVEGRAPMHVKIGDIVVHPQVPANEVELNGERYFFLHEEQHVLAVVEPEDVDLSEWARERYLEAA